MEIVRLHKRGMSMADIAPKFGRTANTIRSIVIGDSYRSVTGREHKPGVPCECLTCGIAHREDGNLEIAEAAVGEFVCVSCGERVERRVTIVRRARGRVLCDFCDGRRRS